MQPVHMEKLLQGFLYSNTESYACRQDYPEKLEKELKAAGLIEKKKVVFTAYATPSKGTVKYKFYYKKKGAKKTVTIRNYSTTRKTTWKAPSKTGTYYVYCKVKDSANKTLTKKITMKVKK